MGIFTDLAIGGITQFDEVAKRDTQTNITMANNALAKENEAFKTTELAYKNFDQVKNIVSNNLEAFNIKPMGNFSTEQLVDMYVGKAFKEQRSIFENSDFNKVKINFANYLARTPGEEFSIDISSPYVSSEDKFEREKDIHAQKLTAISKTPRVDKLLLNLKKIDEQNEMPVVDQMGDAQLKIASITAKGYGIFNTFPGTAEGNANLNFMKVNIITANAKAKFPNDTKARSQFIDQKLYENNINPLDAINFKSPMTFKLMSNIIDQAGVGIANQIANNMNIIAQSTDNKEIAEAQQQNNKLLLSQLKLVDGFSGEAGTTIAGVDRFKVFPTKETQLQTQETTTQVPEGYIPRINRRGEVILPGGQALPLDNLFMNYDVNKKVLPKEVLTFVEPFRQYFNEDGIMLKPDRNMFPEGVEGDQLFNKFNIIFRALMPTDADLATLGGYGFIEAGEVPPRLPSKPKSFINPKEIKTKAKKSKTITQGELGEKTFIYKGQKYNVPKNLEKFSLNEGLKAYIANDLDPKARKIIDDIINNK